MLVSGREIHINNESVFVFKMVNQLDDTESSYVRICFPPEETVKCRSGNLGKQHFNLYVWHSTCKVHRWSKNAKVDSRMPLEASHHWGSRLFNVTNYSSFREGAKFQPFFGCCATFHLPGTPKKHRGFEDFLTQETLKVRIDPLMLLSLWSYTKVGWWFLQICFFSCWTLTNWEKLNHIDPIWWGCFIIFNLVEPTNLVWIYLSLIDPL